MKLEFEGTPLEYAKSTSITELKKKVKAIKSSEYDEFTDRCRVCFEKYIAGDIESAQWWSKHAEAARG
jgi:hypothetical protein